MSVLVVFAVRLVVFLVERDQVVQRKTIMCGDEVDTGPWLAATPGKGVGRSGKPRCHFGCLTLVALPERAYGVAKLVVPLRPARREAPDLIAARAEIPRFGDHLHRRQHRILHAALQEAVRL